MPMVQHKDNIRSHLQNVARCRRLFPTEPFPPMSIWWTMAKNAQRNEKNYTGGGEAINSVHDMIRNSASNTKPTRRQRDLKEDKEQLTFSYQLG